MAITFANVATANSTASAATLVASSVTVSAGLWVVVGIAADNAGTSGASSISSVTDSAGNTYTQLSIVNRTAGSASNDGTTLGIFLGKITTALSSGSITANFSPNTASKAMSIKSISVDTSGETLFYQVGAGVTGSGTAYSAGAVSVTNGYTIYGATALEQIAAATADSDTTNGSWSTAHTASADNGGSNSASQSITTQQKTVTATGNQTYDTSSASTRDFAVNYVIFYSAVPPALTFTDLATANSTSSSATLVASSVTVPVGDWVVVAVAADNNGTNGAASLTTVTDSAGNTYNQQSLTNQDPGAASEGTTLGIYLAKITTALSAGSITANFSPNTTSKAMSVKGISVAAGKTLAVQTIGAGVTGSGTSYSTGAVSVTNGYTIYGATALEQGSAATADSDTTNGSWSTAHTAAASTGTNSTSQSITTQQKTVTATGNQSYDTSSGSTRDYALNYLIFFGATAYSLTLDAGTYTFTGKDATLTKGTALNNYTLTSAVGSFNETGQAANLLRGRRLGGDLGSFNETGQAAGLLYGRDLISAVGAFNEAGQPATLSATRKVIGAVGAFTEAGKDALLEYGRVMPAGVGSYVLSGQDATLAKGAPLFADAGNFTQSGQSADLVATRKLTSGTGSFTQSGQAAALLRGLRTTGEAGVVALTGQDAGISATRRLSATGGAFTASGQSAGFQGQKYLPGAAGTLSATGQDADLLVGRRVAGVADAFTAAGQSVELIVIRQIAAAAETFTIAGQNADLLGTRAISGSSDAFALTGQVATLIYVPVLQNYTLPGAAEALIVTGKDADLLNSRNLVGTAGPFTFTGQQATPKAARLLTGAATSYALTGKTSTMTKTQRRRVLIFM